MLCSNTPLHDGPWDDIECMSLQSNLAIWHGEFEVLQAFSDTLFYLLLFEILPSKNSPP